MREAFIAWPIVWWIACIFGVAKLHESGDDGAGLFMSALIAWLIIGVAPLVIGTLAGYFYSKIWR